MVAGLTSIQIGDNGQTGRSTSSLLAADDTNQHSIVIASSVIVIALHGIGWQNTSQNTS